MRNKDIIEKEVKTIITNVTDKSKEGVTFVFSADKMEQLIEKVSEYQRHVSADTYKDKVGTTDYNDDVRNYILHEEEVDELIY